MIFEIREYDNGFETVKQIFMIEKSGKEWSIPSDPANSDYQAYLAWLEDQAL